ncbi:MAG: hypothetical protein U0V64_14870 [Cyclobacteriaceae bacterium]
MSCAIQKPVLRAGKRRPADQSFQDAKLAKEHYPEFRLVTPNIQDVYDKVSKSHPRVSSSQSQGDHTRILTAKEFALKDNQEDHSGMGFS